MQVRIAAAGLALAGLTLSGCISGEEPSSASQWTASEPARSADNTPTAAPRPSAPAAPRSATATVPPGPLASGGWKYAFPVVASPVTYYTTHSGYPATDIFADCGSPARAVTDGVVLEVSRVDRFDAAHPSGALKGGLFVSIRGDDGVRYYGSHLSAVLPGIERGVRVRGGQRLGSVGHTGDASNICHLHFGISPPCQGTADWWIRRGVIWPWSYLDAWRNGVAKTPAPAVAAWQRDRGCPAAP